MMTISLQTVPVSMASKVINTGVVSVTVLGGGSVKAFPSTLSLPNKSNVYFERVCLTQLRCFMDEDNELQKIQVVCPASE